ncbi:MAG: hypothetical protein ACFFDC_06525 [Promethearchaeota archaeon]
MEEIKNLDLNGDSLVKNQKIVNKLNHDRQTILYRVFLYFFDEIRGHIPLFVYPSLPVNENERQILSVHSIWWHQDKFLTPFKFNSIDLEIGGVIYSATLFLCHTRRTKRRSGMDSSKWKPERFVLIIKVPSSVSINTKEILHKLKTRIQGDVGEDLCFLVEDYLRKTNSQVDEFLEKKANRILKQLEFICKSNLNKNENKPITQPKKKIKSGFSQLPEFKKFRVSIPKWKNS